MPSRISYSSCRLGPGGTRPRTLPMTMMVVEEVMVVTRLMVMMLVVALVVVVVVVRVGVMAMV